jgi:hypothetical protein
LSDNTCRREPKGQSMMNDETLERLLSQSAPTTCRRPDDLATLSIRVNGPILIIRSLKVESPALANAVRRRADRRGWVVHVLEAAARGETLIEPAEHLARASGEMVKLSAVLAAWYRQLSTDTRELPYVGEVTEQVLLWQRQANEHREAMVQHLDDFNAAMDRR